MKKFKIDINQETVNYMQKLAYEVGARQDVIGNLLELHKFDTDTSLFDSVPFRAYTTQLAEVKAEYELAKQELQTRFIPEEVQALPHNWELNFATNDLVITLMQDAEITLAEGMSVLE
ncbi:hypothetical protein [Anaerolentibacter hominis]|uniref:hypothetical protein n=1 Tax=Anaerolentibacter hominis TaxID=3079009 RepID=UPI0031B8531E